MLQMLGFMVAYNYFCMDLMSLLSPSKFTEEWCIQTLNVGLLLTLQITYMAGMTKAPAEHQNSWLWAGGQAGRKAGWLTKLVVRAIAPHGMYKSKSHGAKHCTNIVHSNGIVCCLF